MADERQSLKRLNFSGVIPSTLLQMIVVDLVCPYMVFQFLITRISWIPALAMVTLFPLAGIITGYIRQHSADLAGILALYLILCVAVSSLVATPLLALNYTVPVAILALLTLFSQWIRRPFLFYIDRYCHTVQSTEALERYNHYWLDNLTYSRTMLRMNQVWAWGQLLTALVLTGLYFIWPQNLFALLLPFIVGLVYLGLTVWSLQYRSSQEHSWQPDPLEEASIQQVEPSER